MLNQEIIIKRLALIKQLYKIGLEQATQFETVATFSILSFHDSIEMFLRLLAEHRNIKSDKFSFLEYWNAIPDLTLKESMSNLNARRVNIKHKGLLPSKSDIDISKINTTDFFNQNTFTQFEINFDEVSMLSLIAYPTVKRYLEKAEVELIKGQFEQCILNASYAFYELLNLYEESKTGFFSNSPFFFGKNLNFHSSFHIGVEDDKLAEFVDLVKDSLDGIQQAIKIMSFGIDYKRFVKFKLLTPIITRMENDEYIAEKIRNIKMTKHNSQYCIDFVVDSCLKLQEFDFDINDIDDDEEFFLEIM